MMKKMLGYIGMMMIIGIIPVRAQWSVTPEIGMTAFKEPQSQNTSWRPGPKIGVGIEYRFQPGLFTLKSGLYYTQRGYSTCYGSNYYSYVDASNPYGSASPRLRSAPAIEPRMASGMDVATDPSGLRQSFFSTLSTNQHYLEIPVLADFSWQLSDHLRFHVGAGPYIGYRIAKQYDWRRYGNDPFVPSDRTAPSFGRNFDWGLSAVAGIEAGPIVVNAGYEMSLGKPYGGASTKINYNTVSLSVGYKFKLGR